MGIPALVTEPEPNYEVRTHSVFDLEKTLVAFIKALFVNTYRLDNPEVNMAQPDAVPFDYVERAQSLMLKVPPNVVRGRVPRTVTGEIDPTQLPNVPSIIVQGIKGVVQTDEHLVTVKIVPCAYDERPDGGGYQDLLNMVEAMLIALTSVGQAGIDQAYPIVLPIHWKLIEEDTQPHFVAELVTEWELPSARPLPQITLGTPYIGDPQPPFP